MGYDYVPMRQMRKALSTWVKAAKKANRSRAVQGLDHLVRTWGNSDTPWATTQRLIDALPPMAQNGKVDKNRVRRNVARAFGNFGGKSTTKTAESGISAGQYFAIFEARIAAIDALTKSAERAALDGENEQELSDGLFEWAWAHYLSSRQGYERKRPQLARAFDTARYGDGTVDELVSESCSDLALILGMRLTKQLRPAPGTLDDPDLWEAENLHTQLTTSMSPAGMDVQIKAAPKQEAAE